MSILQHSYASSRVGQAGRPQGMVPAGAVRSMKIGGDVKQVDSVTIGSAADATYTLSIKPSGISTQTVTYSEGATGTTTTKATGLAAQINVHPTLSKYVVASSAAAVITITSLHPGESFTTTESDSNINTPSTSTANAALPSLNPGTAAVLEYGSSGDKEKVTDPDEDDAVTQLDTITVASATNNEIYTVTVVGDLDGDGEPETYTASYQDAAATETRAVAALVAALNAQFPANSVIAADADPDITLTGEIAGLVFKTTTSVTDDAGAAAAGSLSIANTTAADEHEFAGLVAMSDTMVYDGSTDAAYDGDKGHIPPIASKGRWWVRLDDDVSSISMSDPVGFRVNSDGTDEVKGSFRNAVSGTDIAILPKTRARWVDGVIKTGIDGHSISLVEFL